MHATQDPLFVPSHARVYVVVVAVPPADYAGLDPLPTRSLIQKRTPAIATTRFHPFVVAVVLAGTHLLGRVVPPARSGGASGMRGDGEGGFMKQL